MLLRLVVLLGLLAAGPAAWAQMPPMALLPSLAAGCVGPAEVERAGPEYPFDEWKDKKGGRVNVDLRFTAPDAAPEVELTGSEGDAAFADAVRTHARRLRVPCLEAGDAARLSRIYSFVPSSRTADASEPTDARALLRDELVKCMRHLHNEKIPEFPRAALREGVQGRVYATLRFTDPATEPTVALFSRRDAQRLLAPAVQRWTRELRLPCLTGESVRMSMSFVYRFEGDGSYGFRPLTLRDLLPMVKGIRERELKLDTSGMNCPFEVDWTYLRPALPNPVSVRGGATTANRPLREFLAGVELDLLSSALDAVYADFTVITVPCLNISLQPKPKEPSK